MNPRRTRRFRSLRTAPPLALAVLLTAVSCSRRAAVELPAEPTEPVAGGTAVVAAASDITGINPLIDGAEAFNKSILDALFLQLFEEQPDFADGPPTFAPELAESWQWSDDERTLAIELRPDVLWSDGAPVTAEDVVWTWQRQTDERIGWVHSDAKEAIEAIEAIDAGRLVRFASASTTRLTELNQGHILPRHRWQKLPPQEWRGNGGWFRDNLVVSGPFRLASWQPDRQIELERNPAYYRQGYPRLDRVVFRIVPEPNNRLTQLLAGTVDYVSQVPPTAVARIEEDPATRLESVWARQYNFLHWNVERQLFAEVVARRALTLAIDRQKLVDTLWFGHAAVGSS
ncbi:MAG: ABC transporter substrate-binding protein, partial [Thermoanaerobaculia bacterium]